MTRPDTMDSDLRPPAEPSGFSLLHPHIQRWVYDAGWPSLHDTQERAIPLLIRPDRDVLISAATSGGKSEAAFMPLLSHLLRHPADCPGFQILTLAPTKALLNDQHHRLLGMCQGTDLPVHLRHGDISDSRKRVALRNPSGILMTTPESLEALLIRQGSKIPTLFRRLDYVVIDELHSFLGQERGAQLLSLLNRIEQSTGRRPARVGLSATLGDLSLAAAQLRPDDPHRVALVTSDAGGQPLRLAVRGYQEAPIDSRPASGPSDEKTAPAPAGVTRRICQHLFKVLRGQDHMVFANSRSRVEEVADLLRSNCERAGIPNEFFPHHGSLSKELRESVEAALKDPTRPTTAVATGTLEMGVDVGSVTSIAQVGPPPSVSSLRQRLGRSGRRGDPAILRAYTSETAIDSRTAFTDQLRNTVVQTTAMLQLLLEGWCEPPDPALLHTSTLVQQVLSAVAQHGGVTPAKAYEQLCGSDGPFTATSPERFGRLLRALAQYEMIGQVPDGTLLLGEAGDRLVNHYDFYAAFKTPDEYRLLHAGQQVGTQPIDFPLHSGDLLIFGGRRWKVTDVDTRKRRIDLTPTSGGRPPLFGGDTPDIHDHVRSRMRILLADTDVPAFLDPTARDLLAEGRATFSRLRLHARSALQTGDHGSVLFHWAGTRTSHTLEQLLRRHSIRADLDGLQITCEATIDRTLTALRGILHTAPVDPVELAAQVDLKPLNKHDHLLDDRLLDEDYGLRGFDIPAAHAVAARILHEHGSA